MGKFNSCILFSPIGGTDPISNYRDGAMLHIARKYKPYKVVMYFSREMYEREKNDARYSATLKKLGQKLSHEFEIEIIDSDIKDVHKFDIFYDKFEKELQRLYAENPEYGLLLNVSSGTPGMKSALQILAAFADIESILPIQVATPVGRQNENHAEKEGYDIDTEWECNDDNNELKFRDRTSISSNLNLSVRLRKNVILKHIKAFNYPAALAIAEEMPLHITADAMALLKAAAAREQLRLKEIPAILSGTKHKIIPVEDFDTKILAEYILWLDMKLKRREYADFIRAITPLIADIFELYLKKKLDIDIAEYCSIDRNSGALRLRREKLDRCEKGREILEILDSNSQQEGFKDSYLSSVSMLWIICSCAKSQTVSDHFTSLRTIEEAIRNTAAHEIVSITPELIESKTSERGRKYSPEGILDALRLGAEYCGLQRTSYEKSYIKMNSLIEEALMR